MVNLEVWMKFVDLIQDKKIDVITDMNEMTMDIVVIDNFDLSVGSATDDDVKIIVKELTKK
jgi:hypothetical protein